MRRDERRGARAGVALIVGPSHSFDAPIARTKMLIDSGTYGRVRMITALNYTDFLYRPRRPEELDTRQGGGVVFSQGAHQVDVARLLAGSPVRSVRAVTGAWDPARPTEGAYTAHAHVRRWRMRVTHLQRLRALRQRRADGLGGRDGSSQGPRALLDHARGGR
jgi:predicted dehydrogenase